MILENIHKHCENTCSCTSYKRYAHMYPYMNAKVTDSLILQSLEGKGGFGNCQYQDPNGFCYAYTEAQKFCSGTWTQPETSIPRQTLDLHTTRLILACRSCLNLYTCFCVQTTTTAVWHQISQQDINRNAIPVWSWWGCVRLCVDAAGSFCVFFWCACLCGVLSSFVSCAFSACACVFQKTRQTPGVQMGLLEARPSGNHVK